MSGEPPDRALDGPDAAPAGHAAGGSSEASPGGPARIVGPSAFLLGPGHVIVHGNAAFLAAYGRESVGQPAREALTDLPPAAFLLMDRVLAEGRPLATRVTLRRGGGHRRLVVAPRRELESAETYGVAIHLRPVTGPAD